MSANPYPVESFKPIPPVGYGRYRYPWRKLNIGQSFFVPSIIADLEPLWNTLTSCRANAQRKTGWRFTMRRDEAHGTFGIRVWRIK